MYRALLSVRVYTFHYTKSRKKKKLSIAVLERINYCFEQDR